jgi:prepilin-type N-terminal cleavage/methylation domain-containing protein
MMHKKPIRGQRGTTLIELMIALALTGIVTLAIMRTYITQHESYLVQDDVATMQQSSRASIDEMTRQIRMAGHEVPLGLPAIVASNTNPDTIQVVYAGKECETHLLSAMGSPSAALHCEDVSCFSENEWVYIYYPDSAWGEWLQISAIDAGAGTLLHQFNPTNLIRSYPTDASVMSLNQVKFYIDNRTDPDNPTLMIQNAGDSAQVYADPITDLQFRYRLANSTIVDAPVLLSDVREVLIDITAQSTLATPGVHADGENPNRKTRTYSSSVSLRNL